MLRQTVVEDPFCNGVISQGDSQFLGFHLPGKLAERFIKEGRRQPQGTIEIDKNAVVFTKRWSDDRFAKFLARKITLQTRPAARRISEIFYKRYLLCVALSIHG